VSRAEKIIVWTGRFSDEQCCVAVLAIYVGALAAFAYIAWLVMR
jgi:hypothetical protein